MAPILFEKADQIGWLTLNRPENRNALSLEVIEAITQKLEEIKNDEEVTILVINGSGTAFCAGHNLKEFSYPNPDMHVIREIFTRCSEMMLKLQQIPQPVIAQVHGIATAAGCQLVAACDLAIAETNAQFATPGVKIGLFCSTPMVPLYRVVGRRRALEMLLSGRFVSAQEALGFGLVNKVVEKNELMDATKAWAEELTKFSRYTLAFGKQTFYRQVDMDEGAAYGYAKEAIALNSLDEDAIEGVSAFLEKRPPVWKKR